MFSPSSSKTLPVWLTDLGLDRIVSKKQLETRYPGKLSQLDHYLKIGLINRFDYKPKQGRKIILYHLTDLGRGVVSQELGLPIYQVPYTVGAQGHIMHALLVGEVRYQLSLRGEQLISDYRNLTRCYVGRVKGKKPDMYILQNGVASTAVEIDRSISIQDARDKVNQWKAKGLRVAWYVSGDTQCRAMNRLQEQDQLFDEFHNLDAIGWNPFYKENLL
jgi:hypothetical protein